DQRSFPMRDVFARLFDPTEIEAVRHRLGVYASQQRGSFPYRLPQSWPDAHRYIADTIRPAILATTEVLFDDPRKGDFHAEQPSRIREVLARSPPSSEVVFVNPYFVPQEKLVALLASQSAAGVAIRVLTNSLAST